VLYQHPSLATITSQSHATVDPPEVDLANPRIAAQRSDAGRWVGLVSSALGVTWEWERAEVWSAIVDGKVCLLFLHANPSSRAMTDGPPPSLSPANAPTTQTLPSTNLRQPNTQRSALQPRRGA
jgi:hypothetical protein